MHMIKLECNEGHCELELSGTGTMLTAEMQTIIRAIFDAMMKATPDFTHTAYANMYRLAVAKAACECIDKQP